MPRLRLKTKLVLAISGLVFALVAALSFLYVSQIFRQRINQSYENADFIAHQVLHAARRALETELPAPRLKPQDPTQARDAIAAILQNDPAVTALLESVVGYNVEVYDTALADRNGVALVHTDPSAVDKPMPSRRSLTSLRDGGFFDQLRAVYGPARVYQVTLPVQRQGAPFGEIRVGLSTLFLKRELVPQLNRALLLSAVALLLSLFIAAFLSNFALRPMEAIARRLDAMTAETERPEPEPGPKPKRTDEFGAVSQRIDRLGRQMHDVREVFSALKGNLDHLMSALQEGLILFTREGRIVLVSASAERFIGRPRGQMLGEMVETIFDDSTRLGRIVLDAFALRQDVPSREIEIEPGRRVQLSLDFIAERGAPIGALLTVRDAESVRRIENEIELSRRLAAIGRLTSGVAHEVKNPINAIVIHLEILRERILQLDPESRRHMDIINSEIHRLDRVVKSLVDFSRPVDLKLTALDLRSLAADVVALADPEANSHHVDIVQNLGPNPLPVRVDPDLIKQAILNVVINGVQAMPEGGTLTLRAFTTSQAAVLEVQDTGAGISPEIRDKIFNLYFTTRKSGSGIGLSLTYRAMQLHNGALELDSEAQQGTTFRFVLPLLAQSEAQAAPDSTASLSVGESAVSPAPEPTVPPPH
jgi:nitrogen-specific signal transduction histidine kinase/HAMP domain-containing protein